MTNRNHSRTNNWRKRTPLPLLDAKVFTSYPFTNGTPTVPFLNH